MLIVGEAIPVEGVGDKVYNKSLYLSLNLAMNLTAPKNKFMYIYFIITNDHYYLLKGENTPFS